MKLSLSWIFDHIDENWKKQDIEFLISKFNQVCAEIEGYEKIHFDLKDFALCKVIKQESDGVVVSIPEWGKEITLPKRSDAGSVFMVKTKDKNISWATLTDFGQGKEGLIPALDVKEEDIKKNWKKQFETDDIIIEVDNKTITHRPDMWGHRGFAREIAAILGLEFKKPEVFLKDIPVQTFDKKVKSTQDNPISIEIKDLNACKRFSGLYFQSIEQKPSNILMVSRFLKVGIRPINAIVDLTNYLTLDWSQPVHAYDATKIEGEKIVARMAKKGETLTLLDDSALELTEQDLVIADAKKVVGLAGVMGGKHSSIDEATKTMFFESANFDAATVRRSAFRHKIRTESSMRFEKTLDPNQNIEGTMRFLKLADDCGLSYECAQEILSVGAPVQEKTLQISHDFFEKRAGIELKEKEVTVPLTRIGFKVEIDTMQDLSKVYSITIPTFRGSKDVEIKEDILEEVVRFYGLDNIALALPKIEKHATDLNPIFRVRKMKHFFANAAQMMEQQNYCLSDENFLQQLGLENISAPAQILNPVSENMKKLIPSLLPGLFKNIKDNLVFHDQLRFFEVGKVWVSDKKDALIENKRIAGIFFDKRSTVDFYECKNYILDLLSLVGIDCKVTEWKQVKEPKDLWVAAFQTAEIYFEGHCLGVVGKVNPVFLSKLDVLPTSDAFFFDLDCDFLSNYKAPGKVFRPLPVYQESFVDFSVFVPLNLTTDSLEKTLLGVDPLVVFVELIDFFEKDDWVDKRSLTFRVWLNNPEKTMEKEEIDTVWQKAVDGLQRVGAVLRD